MQDQLVCKRFVLFPTEKFDKKKKPQAENSQILHFLEYSPIHASVSGLTLNSWVNFLPFYYMFICATYVTP